MFDQHAVMAITGNRFEHDAADQHDSGKAAFKGNLVDALVRQCEIVAPAPVKNRQDAVAIGRRQGALARRYQHRAQRIGHAATIVICHRQSIAAGRRRAGHQILDYAVLESHPQIGITFVVGNLRRQESRRQPAVIDGTAHVDRALAVHQNAEHATGFAGGGRRVALVADGGQPGNLTDLHAGHRDYIVRPQSGLSAGGTGPCTHADQRTKGTGRRAAINKVRDHRLYVAPGRGRACPRPNIYFRTVNENARIRGNGHCHETLSSRGLCV